MIARLGISLTVGAFVTAFIIRSLSVEDYGIYTVLYCLIGYVSVIGSFGIPAVFQRFIPEALQKKEYSLLKRLVLRGMIVRVLLSIATVSVILLFHGPIGRLLKLEDFIGYFSIFAWGILLSLEATLLTKVLQSLFLHKYSVIASTIHTIFRGICVFFVLQMGWGIRGILWSEVASWGLCASLQAFFYYYKFHRIHREKDKAKLPLRRYLRYGGFSSLNELGNSVLGVSTDFFVIAAFLGPGAVAIYAFAHRVIRLFVNCMPHTVLIDVIRPAFFAKYTESGNRQHLADMFHLLVKIGAFCVFPLVAGIFVLGDKMIAIVFKPEYLVAKPILCILIVSTAISVFAQPTGLVLKAIERVEFQLYSRVFAVYNLIVELLVIHRFGVLGVMLVTCSAVLMRDLYLYYCMKKITGMSMDWRGLSVVAVNAGVMALVLWPLRPWATEFCSLALLAIFGGGVYLLASWLNKAFSTQERDWINRIAPRPVFVF